MNCTLISLFAVKKTEELSCSCSSQPFLASLDLAAISKNFNSKLSQDTSFSGFDDMTVYFVTTYQAKLYCSALNWFKQNSFIIHFLIEHGGIK